MYLRKPMLWHLRDHGIEVRADLPSVGENLSNHAIVFLGLLQNRDARQAEWLHRKLEAFVVPQALVGRETAEGVVPARLGRIFRDRDEARSSEHIEVAMAQALGQSRHLIVLCTPNAVAPGSWVPREIELFRMIRVPARASVFVCLGLSVLAGFGLDRIRRIGLKALLAGVALLEATSAPLNVVAAERCIDGREPAPPVYAWLRAQPLDAPAIELPILPNDGLFQRPRFDDSVYLLRSTTHWKRLVNGYAGTEPAQYARVREVMRDFPSNESIALLRSLEVRYVLVHLRGFGPNRRKAIEERLKDYASELRESGRFGDDLALELIGAPATPGVR